MLVACTRSPVPAEPPRPADQLRCFTIWLGGARIGTAVETETWSATGVELRRTEHMRFRRGSADVELATSIDIEADRALVARRVRWSERGSELHTAEATRDASGWHVAFGPVPVHARGLSDVDPEAAPGGRSSRGSSDDVLDLAGDAMPAELVPLVIRRDGRFAGTVFLPARGFAAGTGRIDPIAPGRLVARFALAGGATVEATIDLDRDGAPARVVDGDGVIALRATETQAAAPFAAVDLIGATAIPIAGRRARARLVLDGEVALPAVPGQRAHPSSEGIELELGRTLPGALPAAELGRERTSDIRALVAAVRGRIRPDLAAGPASARDAAAATTGDCTTFALAYAGLALERGIPTRVVTGLRVDGDRLVRHRWAVSWTGRAWIAVDAAYGAAPAGGDLIGLAIDDADEAGLVAGEAALAQVRAARWD